MISKEPVIKVGLVEEKQNIVGRFDGEFILPGGERMSGEFEARMDGSAVVLRAQDGREMRREEISCRSTGASFVMRNMVIGIHFHWERAEDETFRGDLRLVCDGAGIMAVNEIGVEEYLKSVISSEMSAGSPMELLKAHAMTSRSWLVAMLERQKSKEKKEGGLRRTTQTDDELIRWYDREDHARFDVCADDHCQRYQGVTKIMSRTAREAVEETRGKFLTSGGEICDARYYKACGGTTDVFASAWENQTVSYLQSISDAPRPFAPIKTEREAARWLKSEPEAYCNTKDGKILRQILPSFDRETTDFFRWRVEYKREELETILNEKSGFNFGTLMDIVPVQRGPSGRIIRLKIVGSQKTLIVGKELEIRRWLSKSHLYSSAFIVETERDPEGIPLKITLIGGGWGHGVGLCQIGAAVMATKGKKAEEIVQHYFRSAELKKLY